MTLPWNNFIFMKKLVVSLEISVLCSFCDPNLLDVNN